MDTGVHGSGEDDGGEEARCLLPRIFCLAAHQCVINVTSDDGITDKAPCGMARRWRVARPASAGVSEHSASTK